MAEYAEKSQVEADAEEVFQVEPRPGARIRFGDQDEGTSKQTEKLPKMGRTSTMGSQISINSIRSIARRNSIDPSLALPVTYRTVSFKIEESKDIHREDVVKAKKDAAAELGDLEWHTLSVHELLERLSTSLTQGLSAEQVARKLQEFGKNTPSKPPGDLTKRVFGYLFGGFGSILLIGGILGMWGFVSLLRNPADPGCSLYNVEAFRKTSSNRKPRTWDRSYSSLRHTSIFQRLAGLVVL